MSTAAKLRDVSFVPNRKFGDVLVDLKLIDEVALNDALIRSIDKKLRLGDLLVSEGLLSLVDLAKTLAAQYELEYADLNTYSFSSQNAQILPEKLARSFGVLPLESKDGVITLATHDPIHVMKQDHLDKRLNATIILKVSTQEQIEAAMKKIYANNVSVDRIVRHLSQKQEKKRPATTPTLTVNVGSGKDTTPSVEALVNKFIERAVMDRGSDIHLDAAEEKVRVRARVDGVLNEIYTYPLDLHASVVSRIKVLAHLDIAEKRNPQDGGFHFEQGKHSIDIRTSTLPTVHGEKVVLRLLDKNKMKGTLAKIGMDMELEAKIRTLLIRPHGIIFITGPTGSGKTTTLYSMLNLIDGIEKNIITVEDPVEYKFDIINQVQVNEKAGLTFSGLLRNILRQDPDVVMIGEVRDQETADLSIRAALTGHLVLSTIHTNDSVSTPNRLINMGIEPFLISSGLSAVLAQRLVRVLCPHCKEKITLDEEDIKLLNTKILAPGAEVFGPVGCLECRNSGYQNRVALFELMIVDEHIQRAIINRDSEAEMTAHLRANGFVSMREDGVRKIVAGITSIEEVLKATL
jgi:type IV pilus assembly protein PilB